MASLSDGLLRKVRAAHSTPIVSRGAADACAAKAPRLISDAMDDKGAVLTRLVQLAMRWIFSKEPLARLGDLLTLIEQVEDRTTALEILESLLRYYVQGTGRVEERDVRALLEQNPTGDPIMQTFIDRYIEQGRREGRREGEAAMLLRQIDRKFGPPSETVRARVGSADPETLLRWSDRILTAESLDAVLH
jgi:hypothetical protein